MVFDAYARYYDLLYRDKDYGVEARYVASHIRRHTSHAGRVLELGCGTGAHAEQLAREGYVVYGVDRSEAMLACAQERRSRLPADVGERLTFEQGDVRTVRMGETYDAVISLFHVMSYQTSNEDISAMLHTVATHLVPGGIFVCDFWYGPAVLTQRPTVRIKRLEAEDVEVIRIAEPEMEPSDNIVTVNYRVLVRDRSSGYTEQLSEAHRMRYFFLPEVDLLFRDARLRRLVAQEWLSARQLSFSTWSAVVVARL